MLTSVFRRALGPPRLSWACLTARTTRCPFILASQSAFAVSSRDTELESERRGPLSSMVSFGGRGESCRSSWCEKA